MPAIRDLSNPNPTLNLFFRVCTPQWRSTLPRMLGGCSDQLLALDTLSRGWTIRSRRSAGRQMVPISQLAVDFQHHRRAVVNIWRL